MKPIDKGADQMGFGTAVAGSFQSSDVVMAEASLACLRQDTAVNHTHGSLL
jgi:hypothetical protein